MPATVNFHYDGNGNLTNDTRRAFAYDDENQLVRVLVTNASGGVTKSDFAYDGLGRRRVRTESRLSSGVWVTNLIVRYVYDGLLVLQERHHNPKVSGTVQSFDSYLWRCLETKAKFIAQVMTGESDLRRIEDVDRAALTYAEVKAIASGNPLVIENARIDAEVARLSRLHCEHQETLYKLRSRVRHMTDELPRLEQRLEAVRRDLTTRQETSGDNFVMVFEGQEVRDRGIAGELLLRRAERLRGTRKDLLVGAIAGFRVFVADNFMGGPEKEIYVAAIGVTVAFFSWVATKARISVAVMLQDSFQPAISLRFSS